MLDYRGHLLIATSPTKLGKTWRMYRHPFTTPPPPFITFKWLNNSLFAGI